MGKRMQSDGFIADLLTTDFAPLNSIRPDLAERLTHYVLTREED